MSLAIRTGVAPQAWLEDTRAMVTASELIRESDRRAESARRTRGR